MGNLHIALGDGLQASIAQISHSISMLFGCHKQLNNMKHLSRWFQPAINDVEISMRGLLCLPLIASPSRKVAVLSLFKSCLFAGTPTCTDPVLVFDLPNMGLFIR